jgi:hypothetical protein
VVIATISLAEHDVNHTLSTLNFAQRAKCIRTAAVVNQETSGSVAALKREVHTLRAQLATAQLSILRTDSPNTTNMMMNIGGVGIGNRTSSPVSVDEVLSSSSMPPTSLLQRFEDEERNIGISNNNNINNNNRNGGNGNMGRFNSPSSYSTSPSNRKKKGIIHTYIQKI